MGFSNLLPLASNRSVMVDPTKANNISHIWENMSKEMAYGKKIDSKKYFFFPLK
jgi:hypothetical protein